MYGYIAIVDPTVVAGSGGFVTTGPQAPGTGAAVLVAEHWSLWLKLSPVVPLQYQVADVVEVGPARVVGFVTNVVLQRVKRPVELAKKGSAVVEYAYSCPFAVPQSPFKSA